jgi:catechol 2,3-dioxygenase-like lactoylglutathione lyase family enzyme
MSASEFSFMKLVVADLAAAERFYCDVFGLEVSHRHASDEHAYGQEESILSGAGRQGSIPLILTRYLRRPPPATGAAWTGFSVADIEATATAIENAGGRIDVPIHSAPSHPVKALVARDPEGHMIEVIEIVADRHAPP